MKRVEQKGWCPFCGKKLISEGKPNKRTFTSDHIHPKSFGGPASWYNLVGVCKTCNTRKGNKTLLEFMMVSNNKTLSKKQRNKRHIRPVKILDISRRGLAALPDRWFDPLATIGYDRSSQIIEDGHAALEEDIRLRNLAQRAIITP